MTPLGRYVLETVVTLFLVAGLAVAVLYAVRRLGVGRPSGPLQLAGRLALDARKAIYLVRIGDTVYIIGASEAGLTKLGEVPSSAIDVLAASDEAPRLVRTPGFQEILDRIRPRPHAGRDEAEAEAESEPSSKPEPDAPQRRGDVT